MSVGGVGAFDLVSRVSMMKGLRHAVDGERIIPFVMSLYGQPWTHSWEDDAGEVHSIPQGEGGEQGDPLMLLLFLLGSTPSARCRLSCVARWRETVRIFGRRVHHLQT